MGVLLAPEAKFPDHCLKDIKQGIVRQGDLVAQLQLDKSVGGNVVLFLESM